MSASPEFYRPPAPPAFSVPAVDEEYYYHHGHSCRTPTGSGITYLREPTTCPPAPRKPLASCRKRLFHGHGHGHGAAEAPLVISLRLDELERIFRPVELETQQGQGQRQGHGHGQGDDNKRRRSSARAGRPPSPDRDGDGGQPNKHAAQLPSN